MEYLATSNNEFADEQQGEKNYSPVLVDNVNFFGKKGGFDIFIERVKCGKATLDWINLFLVLLSDISGILNFQFASKWINLMKDQVCNFVLNMTEQKMKDTSKSDFKNFVGKRKKKIIIDTSSF